MRCDRVEVALDNARERGTIGSLVSRDDAIRRRVLCQIVRIVEIGWRSSGLARPVEAGIIRATKKKRRLGPQRARRSRRLGNRETFVVFVSFVAKISVPSVAHYSSSPDTLRVPDFSARTFMM